MCKSVKLLLCASPRLCASASEPQSGACGEETSLCARAPQLEESRKKNVFAWSVCENAFFIQRLYGLSAACPCCLCSLPCNKPACCVVVVVVVARVSPAGGSICTYFDSSTSLCPADRKLQTLDSKSVPQHFLPNISLLICYKAHMRQQRPEKQTVFPL